MEKRNYFIDLLRFIAAFMVVCLHFPIKNAFGDMVIYISRVAVPLFFVISGYFVYDENNEKRNVKLIKQIKHIAALTVFAVIVYFLYDFHEVINGKPLKVFLVGIFNWENIKLLLVFNSSALCPILWFMYALLYTSVTMYFLNKLNNYKLLYIMMVILFLFNYLLGAYSKLLFNVEFPIYYVRNWLFTGLPYYILGIFIRTHKPIIKNNIVLIVLIVLACLGVLCEATFISVVAYRDAENYIFTLILAYLVMIFALQNPINDNIFSKLGRKYSFYIYIFQFAVGGTYVMKFGRSNYSFLIVFVICLLFSAAYVYVKDKIKRIKS